jgi:hypothetical protein
MPDKRVVMRSDYNESCLVTSGYVTAGKSRLSGNRFAGKKRHRSSGHEQCDNTCVYRKLYTSLYM